MRIFFLYLLFIPFLQASELQAIKDVRLIPTDWADGDSFRVEFPDSSQHTIRLYGVDSIEWHITNESDATRLRSQRRYFGISSFRGSYAESIRLAKTVAEAASLRTVAMLSSSFTVHTSFADGRGSAQYKRIYGFVTTSEGKDLATVLVSEGLARAYGVVRSTPDGQSPNDYRDLLKDTELVAASKAKGAWAYTDWDSLTEEREKQRSENQEERVALGTQTATNSVNINSASRDELMRIPGVGEITALAIIQARPFGQVKDLTRVRGIGDKTLEKLRPWVKVN